MYIHIFFREPTVKHLLAHHSAMTILLISYTRVRQSSENLYLFSEATCKGFHNSQGIDLYYFKHMESLPYHTMAML